MATYVMSDIHGLYNKFHDMLELIEFSETDKLYIIGDIIDRGSDGIKLYQEIINMSNVEVIKGNHEVFFLDTMKICWDKKNDKWLNIDEDRLRMRSSLWFSNGGYPTFKEFLKLDSQNQYELFKYISNEKDYKLISINKEKYLLIHAGLYINNDLSLEQMLERNLKHELHLWIREDFLDSEKTLEDTTIIFGHTMTYYIPAYLYQLELTKKNLKECSKGRIFHGIGKIGIDCGCAMELNLGCLCLETMTEFYT